MTYEVTLTASGEEALDRLRVKLVAVMLLDVCLQGLSGIDMLKQLRQINIYTQAIILTGFRTRETAIKALELELVITLFKAFDAAHIEAVVSHCRDRFHFMIS